LNRVSLEAMVRYVQSRTGFTGRIAVVLGSGLGAFSEGLTNPRVIPYAAIPNYPLPSVEGHSGELVSGFLNDIPLLVAKGRFHRYEGHGLERVTLPIPLRFMPWELDELSSPMRPVLSSPSSLQGHSCSSPAIWTALFRSTPDNLSQLRYLLITFPSYWK